MNPDTGSAYRAILEPDIDRVEVVDDETVTFHLKHPSRPFLANLTERSGHILSPTAVERLGEDFGANPVGTGRFELDEWIVGRTIKLKKFDNYWNKEELYLDAVLYQDVPDTTVQLAMLRTGETDILLNVRAADVPTVERNPNLRVVPVFGRIYTLTMNVATPPFDNKALRAAIAYSLDRQELVDLFFEGRGQPAYANEPPISWTYNPDIKPYTHDIAKAKAKLAEAGYPDGVTIPLWCRATSLEIFRCEVFQAQMAEAGINAEIKNVVAGDWWASFRDYYKGERTLLGLWYYSIRADPHQTIHRSFHSKGGSNVMDYNNPEVDRLIEEAATIYDTAKAKVLYDEIQRITAEDAPKVFFAHPPEFVAMSNKVKNFGWRTDFRLRVHDIWLEK